MSQTNRSIIIPAQSGSVPGIYSDLVEGRYFTCISASAGFKLAPDDGRRINLSAGRSFGSASLPTFRRLVFYNETASDINVEYYAGSEPYKADEAVVASITGSLANAIATNVAATPLQFLKTSTAAAVPVKLTATETFFRKAIVLACKSLDGTVNVGDVRIGPSATSSQQPIVIPPGGEYTLEPPVGAKWDFQAWYLDVDNNDDGVVVIYT